MRLGRRREKADYLQAQFRRLRAGRGQKGRLVPSPLRS
jgi:hypothetical protein